MVITIKFRIISSPVAGLASVPSSASSSGRELFCHTPP